MTDHRLFYLALAILNALIALIWLGDGHPVLAALYAVIATAGISNEMREGAS